MLVHESFCEGMIQSVFVLVQLAIFQVMPWLGHAQILWVVLVINIFPYMLP